MTDKSSRNMAQKTEKYENGPLYEDEFKVYEDSDDEFEFRAHRNQCKDDGSMVSEELKRRRERMYIDPEHEQMVFELTLREYYDYCHEQLNGRDLEGNDVSGLNWGQFREIYKVDEKYGVYEEFCRNNPGVSDIFCFS